MKPPTASPAIVTSASGIATPGWASRSPTESARAQPSRMKADGTAPPATPHARPRLVASPKWEASARRARQTHPTIERHPVGAGAAGVDEGGLRERAARTPKARGGGG